MQQNKNRTIKRYVPALLPLHHTILKNLIHFLTQKEHPQPRMFKKKESHIFYSLQLCFFFTFLYRTFWWSKTASFLFWSLDA